MVQGMLIFIIFIQITQTHCSVFVKILNALFVKQLVGLFLSVSKQIQIESKQIFYLLF